MTSQVVSARTILLSHSGFGVCHSGFGVCVAWLAPPGLRLPLLTKRRCLAAHPSSWVADVPLLATFTYVVCMHSPGIGRLLLVMIAHARHEASHLSEAAVGLLGGLDECDLFVALSGGGAAPQYLTAAFDRHSGWLLREVRDSPNRYRTAVPMVSGNGFKNDKEYFTTHSSVGYFKAASPNSPKSDQLPEVAWTDDCDGWGRGASRHCNNRTPKATEHAATSHYVGIVVEVVPLRTAHRPRILIDARGDAYFIDGHHREVMHVSLLHATMLTCICDLHK